MTTFGRASLRQPSAATAPGASTPAKGCQASCPFRGGSHAAGALPLGAVDGSPVAEHRDPIRDPWMTAATSTPPVIG